MTEKEFSLKVVNKLSTYFDSTSEVWSECGKYRIDYVLTHKKTKKPFGIEFKRFERKRGEEIGEYILQAQRYSNTKFKTVNGYSKMPIMICPPLSYNYLICREGEPIIANNEYGVQAEYYKDRHPKNFEHHTVNGILGAFGVGEIRTELVRGTQFLRFILSNRILWSESKVGLSYDLYSDGLHIKNYEKSLK